MTEPQEKNMSGNKIRAVIAVAGIIDRRGNSYTEDALRNAADGLRYFYDDATKSLIYEGPFPAPIVSP